jgi:hypothetical protein
MTAPTTVTPQNTTLARPHPHATKKPLPSLRVLLDTPLSSTPDFSNSTRHSVTSRIAPNSRPLSHLIFSTRHLNATPENRINVEKFNTRLRFFAASHSLAKPKIAPLNERSRHPSSSTFSPGLPHRPLAGPHAPFFLPLKHRHIRRHRTPDAQPRSHPSCLFFNLLRAVRRASLRATHPWSLSLFCVINIARAKRLLFACRLLLCRRASAAGKRSSDRGGISPCGLCKNCRSTGTSIAHDNN